MKRTKKIVVKLAQLWKKLKVKKVPNKITLGSFLKQCNFKYPTRAYVNGKKATKRRQLHNNDNIIIAPELIFPKKISVKLAQPYDEVKIKRIPDGFTLGNFLEKYDIEHTDIVYVNGNKKVTKRRKLHNGDMIGVLPPLHHYRKKRRKK